MALNPLGRAQAEEAGRLLSTIVAQVDVLDYVASPLERTRDTMELLRGALGLDPSGYRTDPLLREITFGAWEGLTWREVRARDPRSAAARERDKWDFVPPGGGESYAMLSERVAPFLAALARPTVVVSHGGVARAFLASLAGMEHKQAAVADIWQGRVLVIDHGAWRWV